MIKKQDISQIIMKNPLDNYYYKGKNYLIIRSILIKQFKITSSSPDNIIQLREGEIIQIKKLLLLKEENNDTEKTKLFFIGNKLINENTLLVHLRWTLKRCERA